MTLTKEKNNTRQRPLPNDERPFKGSNVHETATIRMPKNGIRSSYEGLCGTRMTGP